jgi:glycosyltransferase involved in cell wall biosynthesis
VRQRLPIPTAIALNSFEAGGTEHQMTELARRLDRRRFCVHVVCLGDRGALRARVDRMAPIVEFPIAGLRSATTLRQLVRFAAWCRTEGIQIVQACDFYTNVFAMAGAALAGVPVRIAARRDVYMPERTAGQQRLQRLAYQLAHRVVANSEACVDRLIEEGVPEWRIARVENGIDVARFQPAAAASRRRVITTVANLRPGKGHDVLLGAAARVIKRVPDARFQIVGDGPERAALERQAAALRISAHVAFLGHRDDVPRVLAESDLFAFPSRMEASPNAVIEAMAAALPIVASRTGGIPELIAHERTGLLVPPGDERALAAALLRLIDRPDLAARLGAGARQDAEGRFSFDRMAGEFEGLLLDEWSARAAPEVLAWAPSSGR